MATKTPQKKWLEMEDSAIVEAMLNHRDGATKGALLREIARKLGRTEQSVIQRYARLRPLIDDQIAEREGLRVTGIAARKKFRTVSRAGPRKCLCCGQQFTSEGPHNRLCTFCRNKDVSPYAPSAC